MKSLARSLTIFAAFVVPAFAQAAFNFSISYHSGCTSGSLCTIGDTILYVINAVLIPVLFAIAFIVFLYGIANAYIFSHGEPEEVSKGHKLILWGLIGFAAMISLWGLVNVVANTFGLAGYGAPPTPQYYPSTY